MNKILSIVLIALVALSNVAFAIDFPMVAYGFVEFNGVKYQDQRITLHSEYLNYDWYFTTNSNGQYTITFNNLQDNLGRKIREGDSVWIDACPYEVNNACRKRFIVSTNPQQISWGIDSSTATSLVTSGATVAGTTPEPTPAPEPKCEYPDINCGDVILPACPTCAVCETCPPAVVCPEEKVCEECQECDNSWLFEILFSLGGLVLGGFSWYSGFKGLINYYVKKAKEAEAAGDKKTAQAYYKRAASMLNTAITKAKSEGYN